MKEITIKYVPSLRDHTEAYSCYDKSVTQTKFDKAVALALTLIGAALGANSFWTGTFDIYSILSIIFIAFGTAKLSGLLDFGKLADTVRFKTNPKFRETHTVVFTEEGMSFEMKGIKSDIDWSFYENFMESENTILLVYGKGQYSVIPKSAFKQDDLDSLKKILSNTFQGDPSL